MMIGIVILILVIYAFVLGCIIVVGTKYDDFMELMDKQEQKGENDNGCTKFSSSAEETGQDD